MEYQKNKPTLTVDVCGLRLKVIRLGKSPRLGGGRAPVGDSQAVRRIHSHFTYEAFFITAGKLELVTEGERRTYERRVVIIPPRVGHYTLPPPDGSFCLLFSFDMGKKHASTAAHIQKRLQEGICELPLSGDVDYYIRAIARKSEENTPAAERDAELLSALVFHELMRLLSPEEEVQTLKKTDARHGAIETYINANFHHRITLSDVAKQVYLSTRQVSRILQQEYGCTLSQLVIQKKLASAQMLIRSTDMKIGDIASQVNLGSENYFYSLFKKAYGMTPLKYRQQCRRNP